MGAKQKVYGGNKIINSTVWIWEETKSNISSISFAVSSNSIIMMILKGWYNKFILKGH